MSKRKRDISRRQFLEGSGAVLAVATAAPALKVDLSAANSTVPDAVSPDVPTTAIRLVVNGTEHRLDVEDRWTLAELLRDYIGLTGTKIGCDRGECGACTVLLDGKPVYSCSNLAVASPTAPQPSTATGPTWPARPKSTASLAVPHESVIPAPPWP